VGFNFTFRYIQVLVHVLLGILRERGVRRVYRPSEGGAGALELEPMAAITNVDGGCARAATVGEGVAVKSSEEEGSMQWWR
jgi:hypothetical protein